MFARKRNAEQAGIYAAQNRDLFGSEIRHGFITQNQIINNLLQSGARLRACNRHLSPLLSHRNILHVKFRP